MLQKAGFSELCDTVDIEDITLQAWIVTLLLEQPVQKPEHCIGFYISSVLKQTN